MAIVENQMVEVKWNNANRKIYEQLGYNFTNSGDLFAVDIKHLTRGSHSEVKYSCDFCKGIFNRQRKKLNKSLNFCTHECSSNYNAEMYKSKAPHINCLYCGSNFRIKNYQKGSTKFCSRTCQGAWTSENKSGENSHLYVERVTVCCSWCNKSIERTKNKLKVNNYHFCDKSCKDTWHKEVFLQSPDFKNNMTKVMLKNLSKKRIKTVDTKPQRIITAMLDKMNINYEIEYKMHPFSMDIFLSDLNMFIEINGTYWHCDPRKYKEINYKQQIKRIVGDKNKKALLDSKGLKVLYLWEIDIIKNTMLCEKLVLYFISNNGSLPNYHSLNYKIIDNNLLIKNELIIPYMYFSEDDIKRISKLDFIKIPKQKKRFDIEFKCENCGKDCTQNRKHYERSKSHFCSVECKNKSIRLIIR